MRAYRFQSTPDHLRSARRCRMRPGPACGGAGGLQPARARAPTALRRTCADGLARRHRARSGRATRSGRPRACVQRLGLGLLHCLCPGARNSGSLRPKNRAYPHAILIASRSRMIAISWPSPIRVPAEIARIGGPPADIEQRPGGGSPRPRDRERRAPRSRRRSSRPDRKAGTQSTAETCGRPSSPD